MCNVKLELLCTGAKAEVALNKDVTLSAFRILGSLSLGAVYLLKGGVFVRWIQRGGGGDFWSRWNSDSYWWHYRGCWNRTGSQWLSGFSSAPALLTASRRSRSPASPASVWPKQPASAVAGRYPEHINKCRRVCTQFVWLVFLVIVVKLCWRFWEILR